MRQRERERGAREREGERERALRMSARIQVKGVEQEAEEFSQCDTQPGSEINCNTIPLVGVCVGGLPLGVVSDTLTMSDVWGS